MTDLLAVESLSRSFDVGRTFPVIGRMKRFLAVDDVSFSIAEGEQLALVGESGSGKSTIAELVVGLQKPDSGAIRLEGTDITALRSSALRRLRRQVQMVFQNPAGSLDPRWTVGRILAEPLKVHGLATSPAERRDRIVELLRLVGLDEHAVDRYPHQFSGGQRQRISIARALAAEPRLLIADEAVSALDVSIQTQILYLLQSLKQRLGLSMLFISHDLGIVKYIADRIAVMYRGRIVEIAPKATLLAAPAHPYTRQLLDAVPSLSAPLHRAASDVSADAGAEAPSGGCRFRHRCPRADQICHDRVPPQTMLGKDHAVACHHPFTDATGPASQPAATPSSGSAPS